MVFTTGRRSTKCGHAFGALGEVHPNAHGLGVSYPNVRGFGHRTGQQHATTSRPKYPTQTRGYGAPILDALAFTVSQIESSSKIVTLIYAAS